jgi:hypothetical protein
MHDHRRNPLSLLALLVLLLGCLPGTAFGYLDPGTGSYIIQILIGGILGGLFAIGVFWKRVVAGIKGLFRPGRTDADKRDR